MNIEKTISEHAVSDILTPMLESQDRIVTEDVAPLFDQATGLDTPPASGSVTTTIEESRNLITAIIRSAWTAPLTMLGGASVISYIAAAYTYLRNRLQGNETYGIPDRRSEISASSPLAANLALLNDRKISNGGAENDGIADGVSMAHLLCGSNSVTKIVDDNHGWVANKADALTQVLGLFPSLEEITINCSSITAQLNRTMSSRALKVIINGCTAIKDSIIIGYYESGHPNFEVHVYGLKTTNSAVNGEAPFYVGKLYFHDYEKGVYRLGGSGSYSNRSIQYLYIGCKGIKTDTIRFFGYTDQYEHLPNLTDVEIGAGACQNITLDHIWNLTAANIYSHILQRLKQDEADCGEGVTITLGATNLAKLDDEQHPEYASLLAELRTTYKYTFA